MCRGAGRSNCHDTVTYQKLDLFTKSSSPICPYAHQPALCLTHDGICRDVDGIVAWDRPSIIKPILLQGKDDYIKTKELWKIIKEYFTKNKIEYKEIYSVNGSMLSKIVNLVYLADYLNLSCCYVKGRSYTRQIY